MNAVQMVTITNNQILFQTLQNTIYKLDLNFCHEINIMEARNHVVMATK